MYGPVFAVFGQSNLEPGFQISIVVDDSCPPDIPFVDIWIVPKSQLMPGTIKRESTVPECYKASREGT